MVSTDIHNKMLGKGNFDSLRDSLYQATEEELQDSIQILANN